MLGHRVSFYSMPHVMDSPKVSFRGVQGIDAQGCHAHDNRGIDFCNVPWCSGVALLSTVPKLAKVACWT